MTNDADTDITWETLDKDTILALVASKGATALGHL